METIKVQHSSKKAICTIPLESSKSESNRALIIQALSAGQVELENLSMARDTQTMIRLLQSDEQTLDVLDAGTTMRFTTAFVTSQDRNTIMTGTTRMQERPIKLLVDALRTLGATIEYKKNDGYPPIHIQSFNQATSAVSIRGDVSSQYISALLMIAPSLPKGLKLTLTGNISSRPYIEMTLQLMSRFGISYDWTDNIISITPQTYQKGLYHVESDWSGASYWFTIVGLANEANIFLKGLKKDSLQGDAAITEIMDALGVKSTFEEGGIRLTQKEAVDHFEYDFTSCPDLAQTVAAYCAAKGIKIHMKGLHSLRIKETDRIAAIDQELRKFGVNCTVIGDDEIIVPNSKTSTPTKPIDTYEDHRMAMAFAPLALKHDLVIEEPSVVDKSYPTYWEHLRIAGFTAK